MKLLSCAFNMDTACVELKFDDGSTIAIDTIAVENEVADNMYQRSELDYLIYNDPLAYVGGKGINNSGGNLCDFIYQNSLSQNVALIEIKTPCTELIGNQYRGTYSFSYDLSGAVNQVLNYRDKLTKEYYSLCHQGSEPFEVLSPKCVVIIGKMASLTPGQVAAFENFRNSLGNVLILTFDELYQRIVDLISVLSESPAQEQNSIEQNDNADELPF